MTLVVSYGGGVNSTAMLCLFRERGVAVDAIVFADTGGELPETYEHIERFSGWCVSQGMPAIERVTKGGRLETLEENCLRMRMLPSLAYGYKGCSHKFKIEPQEKWATARFGARFKAGEKVQKAIGYAADEAHRARARDDKRWDYWYPLVDWDVGRADCVAAIRRAGLPVPGKSSCFFCPATRAVEVQRLRRTHPALFQRALALEANAELDTVKGLGRRFAWRDVDDFLGRQLELPLPCECVDG